MRVRVWLLGFFDLLAVNLRMERKTSCSLSDLQDLNCWDWDAYAAFLKTKDMESFNFATCLIFLSNIASLVNAVRFQSSITKFLDAANELGLRWFQHCWPCVTDLSFCCKDRKHPFRSVLRQMQLEHLLVDCNVQLPNQPTQLEIHGTRRIYSQVYPNGKHSRASLHLKLLLRDAQVIVEASYLRVSRSQGHCAQLN